MICKECGKEHSNSSRVCPKINGQVVCCGTCNDCDNYDSAGMPACRFYINNPQPNYGEEIYKLSRKIESKKKIANSLYKQNKPNAAWNCEMEKNSLIREKKKLEALRNGRQII